MSYKVLRDHDGSYAISTSDGSSQTPVGTVEQAEAKCSHLNGGDGLTKRERFAMAAMQGLAASDAYSQATPTKLALWSVEQADELIAALEKKP